MKNLRLFPVIFSLLFISGCVIKKQSVTHFITVNQKPEASRRVPDEFGFAKDFIQSLQDTGAAVQEIHPSKLNTFFRDTHKAVFIKTDKGALDAVFFKTEDDVKQILISDNTGKDSTYHRYLVQKPPLTNQSIEGGICYFTKYRNVFIITTDNQTNDFLKKLPQ